MHWDLCTVCGSGAHRAEGALDAGPDDGVVKLHVAHAIVEADRRFVGRA